MFAHLLYISTDDTLCFDFYDASAFYVAKAYVSPSVMQFMQVPTVRTVFSNTGIQQVVHGNEQ